MVPVTPRGFKDVLPEEARIREDLRRRIQKAFDLWGYDPIETPALEMLDVLEMGSRLERPMFRLIDGDDNLLVLRPDVTLSIARMVATRLSGSGLPLRFRYDMSVFRDNESSRGSSREFTQLGIEQIGMGGPAADAETLIAFVESLSACGLEDFKIEFCNVEVLESLLESSGMDGAFAQKVKAAYHASNHVMLDKIVDDALAAGGSGTGGSGSASSADATSGAGSIDADLARCIKGLIRIHGGRDAILECSKLLAGRVRDAVFDELLATWDLVESCGYASHIGVDFSLLSSFDYYTGIIFEAFSPGFGMPIGGGGRYDKLLEAFGKNAPAAGFAFSLENLMHALSVQGSLGSTPQEKVLVQGCDAAAFAKAMEIHGQGSTAILGGGR